MHAWTSPWLPMPLQARHRDFLSRRVCGQQRRSDPGVPLERVIRQPSRSLVHNLFVAMRLSTSLRTVLQTLSTTQRLTQQHSQRNENHRESIRLLTERISREAAGRPDSRRPDPLSREPVLKIREHTVAAFTVIRPQVHRVEARVAYPRVTAALARQVASGERRSQVATSVTASVADVQPRPASRDIARAASISWPLPPQELARLTTSVSAQVISQLERRALSLRERSGRA